MKEKDTIKKKLIYISILFIISFVIALPITKDTTFLRLSPIPIISDIWLWIKNHNYHFGLDILGGTSLEYKIDLSKVDRSDLNTISNGILKVIEKRVNNLGVAESNIYLANTSLGGKNIIVELPGIKDIDEAIKVVGKTVLLEFKEQKSEYTKEELDEINKYNDEVVEKSNKILNELKIKQKEKDFDFISFAKQNSDENIVESDWLYEDELPIGLREIINYNKGQIADKVIKVGSEDSQNPTLQIPYVTDKRENDRKIFEPEKYRLSHIVIGFEGSSLSTFNKNIRLKKDEAKEKAEKILSDILSGNTTFENEVKNSDEINSAKNNGDIGFVTKDGIMPEIAEAVFTGSTSIGNVIPKVIETGFGYHIVKVTDYKKSGNETKKEPQIKYISLILKLKSTKPQEGWAETGLTGTQFKRADVTFDQLGRPQVSIRFNDEGTKLFTELTRKNLQKPIAIFLDGQLLTSPVVQTEITNGEAVITGNFNTQSAMALARDLNTGAIPAPIILVAQNNIGPLIGHNALKYSIYASILAFICISVFMIWYYKLSGLIAVIALIFYTTLMLSIIKLVPITLTVAGIAGMILSVGMAVDANILIFSRIKEELYVNKKSLHVAIEIGFNRAWSAIWDSHISSLLTAIILFIFGTGMVRGFAVILMIGIILSLFSAVYLTKQIILLFMYENKIPKNEKLFV